MFIFVFLSFYFCVSCFVKYFVFWIFVLGGQNVFLVFCYVSIHPFAGAVVVVVVCGEEKGRKIHTRPGL